MNIKTKRAKDLCGDEAVMKAVDALNGRLSGVGRVLLRPSGTEPLLRVMVEGQDVAQVQRHAEDLAQEIGVIEGRIGVLD